MAFINKISADGNAISIYRARNGNIVKILKNEVPNIISRTRSVVLDSANYPLKCKDVVIRKGKLVCADVYTRAKDGSTLVKYKNGTSRLFTNLRFLDIASKFLK